ncbi:MAG: hypothetical protein IAE91_00760, partial [Ignavibacteriaceae bacterium]|nr:hypothetical protein [Ignavibacteriaceae bacterium]
FKEKTENNRNFSGDSIIKYVENYSRGQSTSNDSLGGIFDYDYSQVQKLNKVIVDSVKSGEKTYYALLLSHPEPQFCRLGLYNETGELLLTDKSLSGYLELTKSKSNPEGFGVTENFNTGGNALVSVFTLYRILPDNKISTTKLFTSYLTPNFSAKTDILYLSSQQIITEIVTDNAGKIEKIKDTLTFDGSNYISNSNRYNKVYLDSLKISSIAGYSSTATSGIPKYTNRIVASLNLYIPENWNMQNKKVKVKSPFKKEILCNQAKSPSGASTVYIFSLEENDLLSDVIDTVLEKEIFEFGYKLKYYNNLPNSERKFTIIDAKCNKTRTVVMIEIGGADRNKLANLKRYMLQSIFMNC